MGSSNHRRVFTHPGLPYWKDPYNFHTGWPIWVIQCYGHTGPVCKQVVQYVNGSQTGAPDRIRVDPLCGSVYYAGPHVMQVHPYNSCLEKDELAYPGLPFVYWGSPLKWNPDTLPGKSMQTKIMTRKQVQLTKVILQARQKQITKHRHRINRKNWVSFKK